MKSNQKAARILKAYLKQADQDEKFEKFDTDKLSEVLGQFYMNVRKQDVNTTRQHRLKTSDML